MRTEPPRGWLARAVAVARNLSHRQVRRWAKHARWAGKRADEVARRAASRWTRRLQRMTKLATAAVKDAMVWTTRLPGRIVERAAGVPKRAYKAARRSMRRARSRSADMREQLDWCRQEWQLRDALERALDGDRPVIVGPWISEVGFEVLYWIPFLHWLRLEFRLDPDRVVAVSRGGVASWYRDIASRYVEIFSLLPPDEFARRNLARGETKQMGLGDLDRELLARARHRAGLGEDAGVVHPSLMYRLFGLFWSGQRPMSFVDAHTRFVLHRAPEVIDLSALPREYVAVKFYTARAMPDAPEIRRALQSLVTNLAEQTAVVLLDTGLAFDDHSDHLFSRSSRIVTAKDLLRPHDNLAVQTQIIAGAQAFVGTCGSLAWLAPMLGVSTAAVLVDPRLLHAHLAVAFRAYQRLRAGSFAMLDLRALDPLRLGPALRAYGSVAPGATTSG